MGRLRLVLSASNEAAVIKNTVATLIFALAVGAMAVGAGRAEMAQQTLTEARVRSKLTEQGYTQVRGVKFNDGKWHAEAKSADGNHVDVHIDPGTGKVYPDQQVPKLSKHDVEAALKTRGYTDVHDVAFDDGVWKAKAANPAGNKVKLRVDAITGKVIGTD
ncbi:MAG: PepSY domain-containing protein [Rhodanobacter sp.]